MTRVYDKYKDRGSIVVAINSFNDTQDQVEKYLEETGLDVPILLGGRELSHKWYAQVAPASFWVDRRGKIVDYEFGYSSDVADRIEAKLEQLLESETELELDKE